MTDNRTVCEIIDMTLSYTNDPGLREPLLVIKNKVLRMEQRLLEYRRGIEHLGFTRNKSQNT